MVKNEVDVITYAENNQTPVRYIMVALQADVIPVLMVDEEK